MAPLTPERRARIIESMEGTAKTLSHLEKQPPDSKNDEIISVLKDHFVFLETMLTSNDDPTTARCPYCGSKAKGRDADV